MAAWSARCPAPVWLGLEITRSPWLVADTPTQGPKDQSSHTPRGGRLRSSTLPPATERRQAQANCSGRRTGVLSSGLHFDPAGAAGRTQLDVRHAATSGRLDALCMPGLGQSAQKPFGAKGLRTHGSPPAGKSGDVPGRVLQQILLISVNPKLAHSTMSSSRPSSSMPAKPLRSKASSNCSRVVFIGYNVNLAVIFEHGDLTRCEPHTAEPAMLAVPAHSFGMKL